MAKFCSVCNETKVGFLNSSNIIDGKICNSCLEKIGLKDTNFNNDKILDLLSADDIKNMITTGETINYKQRIEEIKQEKKQEKADKNSDYTELVSTFKDKGSVKYHGLYFDGERKIILSPKTLFDDYKLMKYSDLISYNPIVREGTITKHHGITRAVVGGSLFGGAGAIVGAATGHKNYSSVSNMSVVLNFKNSYTKTINFITSDTKTNSLTFKSIDKQFSEYCAFIERIILDNENRKSDLGNTEKNDLSNQLNELKRLLDNDVITQEDFDAKKKQILGI